METDVSYMHISVLRRKREGEVFCIRRWNKKRKHHTRRKMRRRKRRRLNKKVSDIPNLWCRGDRSDSKVALFVSAEHKLP